MTTVTLEVPGENVDESKGGAVGHDDDRSFLSDNSSNVLPPLPPSPMKEQGVGSLIRRGSVNLLKNIVEKSSSVLNVGSDVESLAKISQHANLLVKEPSSRRVDEDLFNITGKLIRGKSKLLVSHRNTMSNMPESIYLPALDNDPDSTPVEDPLYIIHEASNRGGIRKTYERQRKNLRRALAFAFNRDPKYRVLLKKVEGLRNILMENEELCSMALIEKVKAEDFIPTCVEAAERELHRMFKVYERNRMLKSEVMRVGPVACPLGHQSKKFEPGEHPKAWEKYPDNPKKRLKFQVRCRICEIKNVVEGYHCDYCDYNVCLKCCVMYCNEGHTLALWTNPESDLTCYACNAGPLAAGYCCPTCRDFCMCDMCSYKDGRLIVQKGMKEEIESLVKFLRKYISESPTALRAVKEYDSYKETDPCPTTLTVFQRLHKFRKDKEQAIYEVKFDRLRKEIRRLKAIYFEGKELCITKMRQFQSDDWEVVTEEELARVKRLIEVDDYGKSEVMRNKTTMACPSGHAMLRYSGCPARYLKAPKKKKRKKHVNPKLLKDPSYLGKMAWEEFMTEAELQYGEKWNLDEYKQYFVSGQPIPLCMCCQRTADEGTHCILCEFQLCLTCSIIYCDEGHQMIMWTVPNADNNINCCWCKESTNLTRGYHCATCDLHACDKCTQLHLRQERRSRWERELSEITQFMLDNRLLSDVAHYQAWRRNNFIVSQGTLVENVKEMRLAYYRARKQVKYKTLIDEMKRLRREILTTLPGELCAASAREAMNTPLYYFDTRKQAMTECKRLQDIIKVGHQAKSEFARENAFICCPLSHAMIPVVSTIKEIARDAAAAAALEKDLDMISQSRKKRSFVSQKKLRGGFGGSPTNQNGGGANTDSTTSGNGAEEDADASRVCRICQGSIVGGQTCILCEYDLCKSCSVVYCRNGHPSVMWTNSEAKGLACDLCRKPELTRGYRCSVCQTDLCDMCTTKDSRDALKMGPSKEIVKVIRQLELLKDKSDIALRNFERVNLDTEKKYMSTMTLLCAELNRLKQAKVDAENEIKEIIRKHREEMYPIIHGHTDA